MRVEATRQAASKHPEFTRAFEHEADDEASFSREESRALVVTTSTAAAQTSPVYREAAFLAHLIATKEHAPQTRERRRVEPSECIAAYQSIQALTN